MSFKKTQNKLDVFDKSKPVSLDFLFEMISCVIEDAYIHNERTSLSKAKTGDIKEFWMAANRIVGDLVPILKANQEGIDSWRPGLKDKYKNGLAELSDYETKIAELSVQIEQAETINSQLDARSSELKRKNEHLLEIEEECKRLEAEIAVLSDSNLENCASRKQALETELAEKRKKNDEIIAQRKIVEAELASCVSEFNALKNAVSQMKKDIEALTEQDKIVRGESHQFEEEIAALQKKLAEYKEWMSQFPSQKKALEEKLSEEKAKHVSLINAWTSMRSDDYVKETLFKLPGTADAFTVESYPDLAVVGTDMSDITMLETWFEQIQNRIDGLLNLQETMVRTVVEQAEKITSYN